MRQRHLTDMANMKVNLTPPKQEIDAEAEAR
jgi:hypothetical protein